MTRCFIALDLPREVMQHIEDISLQIKKQNFFTGKFTDIENLHLTLKFLGEIDDIKAEEVKGRLGKIESKSFDVRLGNVGTFGEGGFIRVIWIELIGAYELFKKIDESLKGLFPIEERFMGHITLARVKNIKDRNGLLDYVKQIKPKELKFKVDRFFLKKSTLSPDGPTYEDLAEYSLKTNTL